MIDEPKPMTLREAAEAVLSDYFDATNPRISKDEMDNIRSALARDLEERKEIVAVLRESQQYADHADDCNLGLPLDHPDRCCDCLLGTFRTRLSALLHRLESTNER